LIAPCGIAPEDDDGNAASKPAPAAPKAAEPKPTPAPAPKAAPAPAPASQKMSEWEIKITAVDEAAWAPMVMDATRVALECTKSKADVQAVFQVNKPTFAKLKAEYNSMYEELLEEIKKTKESFEE
jgi:pyruvate/2-oxoglutarate dehydrogenase complex dihydrolipoamide acyltransferase (E2) component